MDVEPMDNTWIILDEREGVGRVDTWSEYLCVSRTHDPDKFEIAICRYEMVGEIPTDWFDDEGQPLPKYSDDTGCLEVPEYYEHRYAGQIVRTKLTGHDGEYLLGELSCDESFGPPITVNRRDTAEIIGLVNDMGWVVAEPQSLLEAIGKSMA